MDSSIIAAIVTGCFWIVFYILRFLFSKKQDVPISKYQIYSQQLHKVLCPLMVQIYYADRDSIVEIESIITKNLPLVSDKILNQFDIVKSNPADNKSYSELKKIVKVHFQWTKKKLKYPYSINKDDKQYFPTTDRNEAIKLFFQILLCIVWTICAFLFSLIMQNSELRKSNMLVTALINVGFFLIPVVLIFTGYFNKE